MPEWGENKLNFFGLLKEYICVYLNGNFNYEKQNTALSLCIKFGKSLLFCVFTFYNGYLWEHFLNSILKFLEIVNRLI